MSRTGTLVSSSRYMPDAAKYNFLIAFLIFLFSVFNILSIKLNNFSEYFSMQDDCIQ